MEELKVGSKAPTFLLKDKDGKSVGMGASRADFTVLYFYPKDNTPGCTIEAQEFSRNLPKFIAKKTVVVGVSGGDERTKKSFCSKYSLTVSLVSDTDFAVSRAYGVYGDKTFMGRIFKGIRRKTFIVDKQGVIVQVFSSVKPAGHAEEVLAALDKLRVVSPSGARVKKLDRSASSPGAKIQGARPASRRSSPAKKNKKTSG